ncbi:MAG: hypothetical protein AAGI38_14220 [Bacteroidota bacterium]
MKKLNALIVLLALLASVTIFTGCGGDEDDPLAVGPTLTFGAGAGFTTGDATIEPNEIITVQVNGVAGDARMATFSIEEDGNILNANRITVTDLNAMDITANPISLSGDERDNFTYLITIIGRDMDGTSNTYGFSIEDRDGVITTETFTITIEVPVVTTPVDSIGGVLFNSAGPVGTGGIDLDTGTGTGSGQTMPAPDSELRDLGIDGGQLDQNWLQKIAPINNAVLRTPDPTFSFATTATKEALAASYALGTDIMESEKISEGDEFLVQNAAGTIFAIRFDEVNVTPSDNDDNYVISIKK